MCTKKLQEDPQHRKALLIRASSLLKKGRFAEAIQDCNSLLRLDERHAGAFYIRGCAFERLGQLEQGIADFTTVLEIDPNHINAAYARGACENKRGNYAKAIEDYHMALEKDQERPVSPSGSRKIRVRNMNYILEMGGSQQSSANKGDAFGGTEDSSKVLHQINGNTLQGKQLFSSG